MKNKYKYPAKLTSARIPGHLWVRIESIGLEYGGLAALFNRGLELALPEFEKAHKAEIRPKAKRVPHSKGTRLAKTQPEARTK